MLPIPGKGNNKMNFVDNIKILFVRGYIFIAVSFLSILVNTIRIIIYGDIKQITTDPNDPRLELGTRSIYMKPAVFERYYYIYSIILSIAFWSGIIGVGLYLWWKKRSAGEEVSK
jgi:hypothetical protein